MWPFKRKKLATVVKQFIGLDTNYSKVASWSEWDVKKAISEGFKSSVPVFACIKKRYDAISSLPLVVETMDGDEWVAQPNHPLQLLLDNPNPMMNTSELMRLLVTHLDLAGNCYWHKIAAGQDGTTKEIWPLAPYPVTVNVQADGLIRTYQIGSNQKTYPADEICHFMFVNPDNLYFGQSPLQAAGKAVDVDNAAQAWQKVSMQNRGVPDFLVSYDADLTPEQVEQAKEVIKDHTGPNSAREPIVTSKANVKQLSMTPVEMDFMDTRRFSREESCSVYGVPSALIAEMGAVNLANSETARRLFWLDTVIPLMDELVAVLNRCLAREFGESNQVRITYDTSNVPALQENYGDKVTNAQVLWSMGVPFNEINQRLELGFDPIDNGDTGYISAGVIPTSYDFESASEEQTDEVIKALLRQKAKQ